MGFLGFGKKKVDDFSDKLKKEYNIESEEDYQTIEPKEEVQVPDTPEEKKQKFVKRISETIQKVEDISTQIYHLQQRIEVLEKKLDVGKFE